MDQGNKSEIFLARDTEAAPQSALRLIWLDAKQAHFIDSNGQRWYFDINKRQWTETTAYDLHPMALQFAQPIENPERTEFESPAAAILYAFKIHFKAQLGRYEADSRNTIIDEKLRLRVEALIPEVRIIVDTIESIENTADLLEKERLKKELGSLIQEFDRPADFE